MIILLYCNTTPMLAKLNTDAKIKKKKKEKSLNPYNRGFDLYCGAAESSVVSDWPLRYSTLVLLLVIVKRSESGWSNASGIDCEIRYLHWTIWCILLFCEQTFTFECCYTTGTFISSQHWYSAISFVVF